jgi:hypothetical protein
MDRLPCEVIVLTMNFSMASDMFRCQEVCKTFYSALEVCKRRRILTKRIEQQLDEYIQKFVLRKQWPACLGCPGLWEEQQAQIAKFMRDTCAVLAGSFPLWCIERPKETIVDKIEWMPRDFNLSVIQWMPGDFNYFVTHDQLSISGLPMIAGHESQWYPDVFFDEPFPGSKSDCCRVLCAGHAMQGMHYVVLNADDKLTSMDDILSRFDLGICQVGYQAQTRRTLILKRQDIRDKVLRAGGTRCLNNERLDKYQTRGYAIP